MKANSRRRVLISSVAMLLVAIVALGTATYAWFTSSTSATADGITVRTSKTSQLEISDDTIAYSAAGFTYSGMSAVMMPASSANGKEWFHTSAASSDAFTAANTKSFSAVESATQNKYVFVDQLNIKNAGDVAIDEIEITVTNFSGDYLRYALVPVASKTPGGDLTMTATQFQANVYGKDTTAYNPVDSTSSISTTAITPKTNRVIEVGKLNAGAEAHYNLFVWFEGQDTDCKDGNAGQGVTNLSFAVSGTPVTETE